MSRDWCSEPDFWVWGPVACSRLARMPCRAARPQARVHMGAGQLPLCPWVRHHASNAVFVHHGLTAQSVWCTHSPVDGVGIGEGGDVEGGVG